MTVEDFRRFALSMPGTMEVSRLGQANFRVGRKTFATIEGPNRFNNLGQAYTGSASHVHFEGACGVCSRARRLGTAWHDDRTNCQGRRSNGARCARYGLEQYRHGGALKRRVWSAGGEKISRFLPDNLPSYFFRSLAGYSPPLRSTRNFTRGRGRKPYWPEQ